MMNTRRTGYVAATVVFQALSVGVVQSQGIGQTVVSLTDPARPAMVSVGTSSGNIVIRGTSRTDVLVRDERADGRGRRRQAEPPPGMRRLMPAPAFLVEERNNEVAIVACSSPQPPPGPVSLDPPNPDPNPRPSPRSRPPSVSVPPPELPFSSIAMSCTRSFSSVHLEIEVPVKTRLRVSTLAGDISVDSVDGVLELNSASGDISLVNVAGSVVAHSVSGDVTAVLTGADAEAPMAFSTLTGDVDVTLPAAIKANVTLRTDGGDMFTDFDVPAAPRPAPARGLPPAEGRHRFEIGRAIVVRVNGGGPEIELRSFNGDTYLRKGK